MTRSRMPTGARDGRPKAFVEAGVADDAEAEWALLASLCSQGGASGPSMRGQYMRATSSLCAASSQQPARSYHVLSTVSMSLHDICWSWKQLAYKVIVDIGCMRSVLGVGWATEVLNRWQAEGRWHRVEKESEAFRFGDGEVLYSRYRIEFVGAFAGQAVVFGFSVVEGVCPPLFSRTGCTQLGVVIDCEHHTISSRKLGVKSYGLGRDEGHYTICIDEPCSNMSVVSLPPDFRLPVGTDAMKLSSEVLLEKERVMEPSGSSAKQWQPNPPSLRGCRLANYATRPTTRRSTARRWWRCPRTRRASR